METQVAGGRGASGHSGNNPWAYFLPLFCAVFLGVTLGMVVSVEVAMWRTEARIEASRAEAKQALRESEKHLQELERERGDHETAKKQ